MSVYIHACPNTRVPKHTLTAMRQAVLAWLAAGLIACFGVSACIPAIDPDGEWQMFTRMFILTILQLLVVTMTAGVFHPQHTRSAAMMLVATSFLGALAVMPTLVLVFRNGDVSSNLSIIQATVVIVYGLLDVIILMVALHGDVISCMTPTPTTSESGLAAELPPYKSRMWQPRPPLTLERPRPTRMTALQSRIVHATPGT